MTPSGNSVPSTPHLPADIRKMDLLPDACCGGHYRKTQLRQVISATHDGAEMEDTLAVIRKSVRMLKQEGEV